MLVVAAYMAEGLRSITENLPPGRLLAAYVDDLSATVFVPRRDIVHLAAEFGSEVMAAVAAVGLKINNGKTAVICDWRPGALAVSAALGVPAKPRGMYAGRNLGCDHAPLRARKWRRSGTVLTVRLLRVRQRLKRFKIIRKATGKVRQWFRSGFAPP